jgi:hypothetical protein
VERPARSPAWRPSAHTQIIAAPPEDAAGVCWINLCRTGMTERASARPPITAEVVAPQRISESCQFLPHAMQQTPSTVAGLALLIGPGRGRKTGTFAICCSRFQFVRGELPLRGAYRFHVECDLRPPVVRCLWIGVAKLTTIGVVVNRVTSVKSMAWTRTTAPTWAGIGRQFTAGEHNQLSLSTKGTAFWSAYWHRLQVRRRPARSTSEVKVMTK